LPVETLDGDCDPDSDAHFLQVPPFLKMLRSQIHDLIGGSTRRTEPHEHSLRDSTVAYGADAACRSDPRIVK
jgi:hypothetical protein